MQEYKYCPFCKESLKVEHIDGKNRKVCPDCNWINYLNPVPVVACLSVDGEGQLLLIKRGIAPCKGSWALPGGFIELGESPEDGGNRELLEETGLIGHNGKIIGACTQKSDNYGSVLVVGVSFDLSTFDLRPGDDAADAAFYPIEKMPDIPFSCHVELIEQFITQRRGVL